MRENCWRPLFLRHSHKPLHTESPDTDTQTHRHGTRTASPSDQQQHPQLVAHPWNRLDEALLLFFSCRETHHHFSARSHVATTQFFLFQYTLASHLPISLLSHQLFALPERGNATDAELIWTHPRDQREHDRLDDCIHCTFQPARAIYSTALSHRVPQQ